MNSVRSADNELYGKVPAIRRSKSICLTSAILQGFARDLQTNMTVAPPPVDSERYHIRTECSNTTHSSLPPCAALRSSLQYLRVVDMKLSGILIPLVIFGLLGDSVSGLWRSCQPTRVCRQVRYPHGPNRCMWTCV